MSSKRLDLVDAPLACRSGERLDFTMMQSDLISIR